MTIRGFAVMLIVWTSLSAWCQVPAPYVPPELQDWTDWVLHDAGELRCPLSLSGARACVWPGRLELNVGPDGGRFSQTVEVFADGWFALPGQPGTWPQDVEVDGNPEPVIERSARPSLYLTRGTHRLSGRFVWTRLPQSVALGNATALLALRIDGEPVPRPRRDRNAVWLATGVQDDNAGQSENRLSMSVYRTVRDGAPPTVEYTLQVRVSGESREENLGRLLRPGMAPEQMAASLPARLSEAGDLIIQARPGEWYFRFVARVPAPLSELTFAPSGQHWPREEVWSYVSAPDIRVTEAVADNPIDPQQAGVPERFAGLPAFRMTAGDTLRVVERQRGRSPAESNQLSLKRDLWLDFDGGGYTAQDRLSGLMLRDWRLDLRNPLVLSSGRSENPGQQDLLITHSADDATVRGVELRNPQVNLTTLARVDERRSVLPVSGWRTRLDGVATTLHLPAGYRLLHAGGADRQPQAWLSRWNLLDFFLLLLAAVAYGRLMSPLVGTLALLGLALSMHEPGAPGWSWINLAVAIALARYLPEGRARTLARGYRWASLGVVLVLLLPFASQQLRAGLFPQLEHAGRSPATLSRGASDYDVAAIQRDAAPAPPGQPRSVSKELENMLASGAQTKSPASQPTASYRDEATRARYASNMQVQTGPGIPAWSWNRYSLSWSGPVDEGQQMRLWMAPPWVMSAWRFGMIAVLLALLALLARPAAIDLRGASSHVAVVGALLFAGMLTPPPAVQAQTPDPALLDELRTRLLRAPECAPRCAELARASVRYDERNLTVTLIAHAAADTVLPIPGASNGWHPDRVLLNGRATEAVRLAADGTGSFELHLPPGVHRVALSGVLPDSGTVSVPFPLPPQQISIGGSGWEVTGVQDGRLSAGALTLVRQRADQPDSGADREEIDVERFPVFVTVQRTLAFTLDWSVTTVVTRQAPRTAPVDLRLPLLDGEAVTSGNVDTEDGNALLSLGAGEQSVRFTSTLERAPSMTLRAATDAPWQEFWTLVVGPSWRLRHQGVPEMNIDRSGESLWLARFAPWPGETLRIDVSRPDAVDGLTLALDSATLSEQVGQRSTTAELALSYRATRGQQYALRLPAGSELTGVDVAGRSLNLAADDTGLLRVPIAPGDGELNLRWRQPHDGGWLTRSANVDLLHAASNVNVTLALSKQRWVLWTFGPRQGPAVLYWSELALLLLAAAALARVGRTPLRFHQWLLLGLGFSTFFWPAFGIVAAALLGLGWRERHAPARPLAFNLLQLVLIGLTIGAAGALVTTIPFGLLGTPDMHVTGNGSRANALRWFVDRSSGPLPDAGVLALPLWMYKALILTWALWLAFALLGWLPWMWRAFSSGGYWKRLRPLVQPTPPSQADDT